jgi:hypothetical protein
MKCKTEQSKKNAKNEQKKSQREDAEILFEGATGGTILKLRSQD